MDKAKQLKKFLGKTLTDHVFLKDLTTFHVGGVADFYFKAKTIQDLIKAVSACWELGIPYYILAGGSNVLVSDYGFPGLVIHNKTSNIAFLLDKAQAIVDSGVPLSQVIMEAASHDLGGMEFLAMVPGTIGGAIYGNAGAWGKTIADYLKLITLLIPDKNNKGKITSFRPEWFTFGYRTSKLKQSSENKKPIILTVKIQFSRIKKEKITENIAEFRKSRIEKQPVGFSAGSIFKNPGLDKERTAGWLLEQAGCKGMKVGDAQVSKKHANFIINKKNATASDIRALVEKMREKVRDKYGIALQEEIEYLGQW